MLQSGTKYTLNVYNGSDSDWDVCVFQKYPDPSARDIIPLAWFVKHAYSTTTLRFQWEIDYSFMWCQTGHLAGGQVVFDASQAWPADPSLSGAAATPSKAGDQVNLKFIEGESDGAYTFQPPAQARAVSAGGLSILVDGTLPQDQTSIGLGMAGNPVFAKQAQSNVNTTFTPKPQYWVAAGNFIEGQTLDVSAVTNVAEISFDPPVYSMAATLDKNNTWKVTPTYKKSLFEAKDAHAAELAAAR